MKKEALILSFLLMSLHLHAQFLGSGFQEGTTGFYGGYKKVSSDQLVLKNRYRLSCAFGPGSGIWDSIGVGHTSSPPLSWRCILLLNNLDSSSKGNYVQLINGTAIPNGGQAFWHKPVQKTCNNCIFPVSVQQRVSQMLITASEFSMDTAFLASPVVPGMLSVDTNMTSISVFHGTFGILQDSMSMFLRNVSPWYLLGSAPKAYMYSRVFRWPDYTNITSPDATNKNMILAAKNKQLTYNPGIVDKEHDSIRVTPLIASFSRNFVFNFPNASCNGGGIPLSVTQQNQIKQTLKDSSVLLQYYAGYSAAQPFGANANYTLSSATGEITFTPQDTGLYLLAYRIEEYRDKQLLGDIMTYRIAYVVNDNVTLPVISNYYALNAGIANNVASQTITVCPGQNLTYRVKATSQLSTAKVVLSTNASLSVPGIITSYTGQGTDSATITYAWVPTAADVGIHYIYTDAVDTACGPGHLQAHQSKGVIVKVIGQMGIGSSALASCGGATVTLTAQGGYNYTWSVLPGGDPYLSCVNCSQLKVHPSMTTHYVLTGTSESCGTKKDTFTVRNIPSYTISAGNDTSFAGAIPSNYNLNVSVIPPAGYYKYQWAPATKVNNQYLQNPKPTNTVNHNIYTVTVTDSFNCYTWVDTIYVRANAASVGNSSKLGAFEIYPNPLSEAFWVSVDYEGRFSLTTIDGREIAVYHLKNGINQLQLPQSIIPGIYLGRYSPVGESRPKSVLKLYYNK